MDFSSILIVLGSSISLVGAVVFGFTFKKPFIHLMTFGVTIAVVAFLFEKFVHY